MRELLTAHVTGPFWVFLALTGLCGVFACISALATWTALRDAHRIAKQRDFLETLLSRYQQLEKERNNGHHR